MQPKTHTKYELAKARVIKIKAFYTHFVTYIVIMGVLFIFNVGLLDAMIPTETNANLRRWIDLNIIFCAIGWGVAVSIHALSVFVKSNKIVRRWEEKKNEAIYGGRQVLKISISPYHKI